MSASARPSSKPRRSFPPRLRSEEGDMSLQPSSDREVERARSQGLSRRTFLHASAALGGGLLVAFSFPPLPRMGQAAAAEGFAPNGFIRIDRDGRVTHIDCQAE